MTTWFVTRHAGAKEWAKAQGISVDRVVDHLAVGEVQAGDLVLGSLPVNLVAELNSKGARYFHLTLDLSEDLRGKEISAELMEQLGAKLEEFGVMNKMQPLQSIKKSLPEILSTKITWLFSLNSTEQYESDPIKKLLNSMRITSRCRFNASVRITRISKYSFFTTTFLSLGLIFIPLVQNSDVSLHFIPKVLNMIQIFLAVAVLVYSVVNSTARYDVRSIALNECGNRLKDLIRTLREEQYKVKNGNSMIDLIPYHTKYREALSESENHSRLDFLLSTLEMDEDYKITGLLRLYSKLKAAIFYMLPFILPSLMMFVEILFILDMLGITHVMPFYFGGDPIDKSIPSK